LTPVSPAGTSAALGLVAGDPVSHSLDATELFGGQWFTPNKPKAEPLAFALRQPFSHRAAQ